jgi:hypothetical protein
MENFCPPLEKSLRRPMANMDCNQTFCKLKSVEIILCSMLRNRNKKKIFLLPSPNTKTGRKTKAKKVFISMSPKTSEANIKRLNSVRFFTLNKINTC